MSGVAPRLRAPAAEDSAFLFKLAAECDLRWPAISRFGAVCTPASVLSALSSCVEAGYLVLDGERQPVGVVGFIDADAPAQALWLDGHAFPGDADGLALVRAAVPVVLDEAERAGTVRVIYHEEYPELGESLIEHQRPLWQPEVVIPQYVCIDGQWCTRITYRMDIATWSERP